MRGCSLVLLSSSCGWWGESPALLPTAAPAPHPKTEHFCPWFQGPVPMEWCVAEESRKQHSTTTSRQPGSAEELELRHTRQVIHSCSAICLAAGECSHFSWAYHSIKEGLHAQCGGNELCSSNGDGTDH